MSLLLLTSTEEKVLEFHPANPEDNFSVAMVKELGIFGNQMNVSSITKQGLMLYTFDILSNKSTTKIKFKDVELGNTLDVPKDIPGFEGTTDALNNLSILVNASSKNSNRIYPIKG